MTLIQGHDIQTDIIRDDCALKNQSFLKKHFTPANDLYFDGLMRDFSMNALYIDVEQR